MIGFISISVTISLNYYSANADWLSLQFTVAHALRFSVSTSRLLATVLNTETSTSNHYEVFLPFIVQLPWNIGTQLKTRLNSFAASGLVLYGRGMDNTENMCHVSEIGVHVTIF
jgi:hypothetical protein